jgi:hypothetical protein
MNDARPLGYLCWTNDTGTGFSLSAEISLCHHCKCSKFIFIAMGTIYIRYYLSLNPSVSLALTLKSYAVSRSSVFT